MENRESKEVFGVRIDVVSYMAQGLSRNDSRYNEGDNAKFGSLKPDRVVFGVYEKGTGGFWAKIKAWFSRIFRFG